MRGTGVERCDARRVREVGGGVLADRVDAAREFIRLPGEYKAVWRFDGTRLGPGLRFGSAEPGSDNQAVSHSQRGVSIEVVAVGLTHC